MRKPLIGLVLSLLTLSLPISSSAYQNEPTGWQGISWGTPFFAVQQELRASLVVPTTNGRTFFERPGKDFSVFGMHADVLYGFSNGVFDAVIMTVPANPVTAIKLERSLVLANGQSTRTTRDEPGLKEMEWTGSSNYMRLKCEWTTSLCSIAIQHVGTLPNPRNTADSVAIQAYKQCMSHCTNMGIICNMGSDESAYTLSFQRCDTRRHICSDECDATLKRQW
jgi:hypothetical protein